VAAYFVDECVAKAIAEGLRSRGFDCIDAKDVCPGDNDERVLALAAAAGRIVVTHDWGFGELTVRRVQPATGVVILALYALTAQVRDSIAVDLIVTLGDGAIGNLSVIEPGRVRTRPLRDIR